MKDINNYISEKLYISKKYKCPTDFTKKEIEKFIINILTDKYKIERGDFSINFGNDANTYDELTLRMLDYKFYYDKGLIPDKKQLLIELTDALENNGIQLKEKPSIFLYDAFTFKIKNVE